MFQSRAAESIKDRNKLGRILNLALRKGMSSDKLKVAWENIRLFISAVRDWMNGEYREIPKRTIIIMVAALLYFISPIDLIPDFIPLTGFLDDATVIGFVFKQVAQDLEKYKVWKEEQEGLEEKQEDLGSSEGLEDL